MLTPFLFLLHASQVGLSLWAGKHSYEAITRLQKYEDTSEKAAKYSGHAQHELHKTRTTETSGAVVILLSLLSSAMLMLGPAPLSSMKLLCALFNIFALVLARQHMSNYWSDKKTVPLIEKYNEAIRYSQRTMELLLYLGASWIAYAAVWVLAAIF